MRFLAGVFMQNRAARCSDRILPVVCACHREPELISVGSGMIGRYRLRCRSRKPPLRLTEVFISNTLLGFSIWAFFACSSSAFATGFYGPVQYLDEGGRNVGLSPEFYWELEVKRLSARFHPPEKLVLVKIEESNEGGAANAQLAASGEADAKDFDQAIKEGRIKPPDPDTVRKDHQ